MRVTETLHLPLTPARVAEMYTDPAYTPLRARSLSAQDVTSTVEGTTDGRFSVTSTLILPTEGVPDMIRRVVGSSVTVQEVQSWQEPEADGSRRGTIRLDVQGTPASMTGDLRLAADGDSASTVTIDGELTARVPLLGRRLEQAAVPYVTSVLAREQSSAAAYAERPSR